MRNRIRVIGAIVALLAVGASAQAGVITLCTPAAGDATWAWNTKYGPYSYGAGGTEMGVSLYFGAPYGNDYTVSIFEIPIAALAGNTVTSATLVVDSLGFRTWLLLRFGVHWLAQHRCVGAHG